MDSSSSMIDIGQYAPRAAKRGTKSYRRYLKRRRTRPRIARQMVGGIHAFASWYRPSTTNLVVDSSSGASYNSTSGLLLGPTTTGAQDAFFYLKFTASDLPNISGLSSLFDSYRINKAEVEFLPAQNVMGNASLNGTPAGLLTQELITVLDYDDAVLPTSQSELEQYESYFRTPPYRYHKRTLVPACAMAVYKTSGLQIGYAQKTKQWLDFAQTDVEHYGVHGCIPCATTGTNTYRCGWYVRVRLWFDCKTVR